jgi:hypothetical protein
LFNVGCRPWCIQLHKLKDGTMPKPCKMLCNLEVALRAIALPDEPISARVNWRC